MRFNCTRQPKPIFFRVVALKRLSFSGPIERNELRYALFKRESFEKCWIEELLIRELMNWWIINSRIDELMNYLGWIDELMNSRIDELMN